MYEFCMKYFCLSCGIMAALRSLEMAASLLLCLLAFFCALASAGCTTQTQPNPIATDSQFLLTPTGVINSTLLVASIPLADAQKLVPNGYKILTKAYQSLLPDFPRDQYPVLLQAVLDHDIRVGALTGLIADFQVR
jgi:hypothetical protein